MTEPYVQGVTGTTLRPKTTGAYTSSSSYGTVRKPSQFTADNNLIEEYKQQQASRQFRDENKQDKGPVWSRILSSPVAKVAAGALKYSSGSELAYKIPGIGDDLEAAANYIPGVRTALAVATNPLTYATGGVGGGLAAAAGAGLGTYAFSDRKRGLGLDMPFVPEKYEESVGGALGGLAGGAGMRQIRVTNAKNAAANAEANIQRMENGALQADDVMHTADGKNFFPRRPTADMVDDPTDWYSVRVKNPGAYQHNPDELSWTHNGAAAEQAAEEAVSGARPMSQAVAESLGRHADDADIISAGVKNSGGGIMGALGKVSDVANAVPGFKAVKRGVGIAMNPKTTAAALGVTGAAYAIAPDETKAFVKKAFAIDHKVGLTVARALLPKTDIDLGVAGLHDVNVEGVGAELFRPSNFINFTPAGLGGNLAVRLGTRAILEGSGNAALMGLETWADGGSKDDILKSMGMGFAAGAALPVGMDVAGEFLGPTFKRIAAAQSDEQILKEAVTMHDAVEKAKAAEGGHAPEAPVEDMPMAAQSIVDRAPTTGASPVAAKLQQHLDDPNSNLNKALTQVGETRPNTGDANVDAAMEQWLAGGVSRGQLDLEQAFSRGMEDPLAKAVYAHFEPVREALREIYPEGTVPLYHSSVRGARPSTLVSAGDERIARAFMENPESRTLQKADVPIEEIVAASEGTLGGMRLEAPDGSDAPYNDFITMRRAFEPERAIEQTPPVAPPRTTGPMDTGKLTGPEGSPATGAEPDLTPFNELPRQANAVVDRAALNPLEFERTPERLTKVVDDTMANGGSSTSIRTGETVAGPGDMVSDPRYTRTFPVDEFQQNGPSILKNFIERNRDILDDEGTYLGTWVDNGEVHVDVSKHMESEAARAQAAETGQKATFDVGEGKVVPIENPRGAVLAEEVTPAMAGEGRYGRTTNREDAMGRPLKDLQEPVIEPGSLADKEAKAKERLFREEKAAAEATGAKVDFSQSDPSPTNPFKDKGYKRTSDGFLEGMPREYTTIKGKKLALNNPAAIKAWRNDLAQKIAKGAGARFWYEDSAQAMMKMVGIDVNPRDPASIQAMSHELLRRFGGDVNKADAFVQAVAITSPQTKVDENTREALVGFYDMLVNEPSMNIKTDAAHERLAKALQGEDWGSLKTNRFYLAHLRFINPKKFARIANAGATIDVWMARAMGLTQMTKTAYQNKRTGFLTNIKPTKVSDWNVLNNVEVPAYAPTILQYKNMAREIAGLRDRMNLDPEIAAGRAPAWTDDQVQAAIWTAEKMLQEGSDVHAAGFDYSDGLRQHQADLEMSFFDEGRITRMFPELKDATPEQLQQVLPILRSVLTDDNGNNDIAQVFTLLGSEESVVPTPSGAPGMTREVIAPLGAGSLQRPMVHENARRVLNGAAAFFGKFFGLENTGWTRPIRGVESFMHNAVGIEPGRLTTDEIISLNGVLEKHGLNATVVAGPQGVHILNNDPRISKIEFGKIQGQNEMPVGFSPERHGEIVQKRQTKAENRRIKKQKGQTLEKTGPTADQVAAEVGQPKWVARDADGNIISGALKKSYNSHVDEFNTGVAKALDEIGAKVQSEPLRVDRGVVGKEQGYDGFINDAGVDTEAIRGLESRMESRLEQAQGRVREVLGEGTAEAAPQRAPQPIDEGKLKEAGGRKTAARGPPESARAQALAEPISPEERRLGDKADALYEELQTARQGGDEQLISELTDEHENALTDLEDYQRAHGSDRAAASVEDASLFGDAETMTPEDVQKDYYGQDLSVNGQSYVNAGEYADLDSVKNIKALEEGQNIGDTDVKVASLNPDHAPIIAQVAQSPGMTRYAELTKNVVDRVREAFKKTGLAPAETDVTYGGFLLDRTHRTGVDGNMYVVTNRAQFNTTPGASGHGMGAASIQTDFLAEMRYSDQIVQGIRDIKEMNPEVHDYLVQTIGKDYNEDEMLAALTADTMMHEMIHRTVMGHDVNFHNALAEFKAQMPDVYDSIVSDYKNLIDGLRASGELDNLKELANDAARIDLARPISHEVAPSSLRNAASSNVEGAGRHLDSGSVPESVRGRVGEDVSSRQSASTEAGATTGAERGRVEATGTANEPVSGGTAGASRPAESTGAAAGRPEPTKPRTVNRIKPGGAKVGDVVKYIGEKHIVKEILPDGRARIASLRNSGVMTGELKKMRVIEPAAEARASSVKEPAKPKKASEFKQVKRKTVEEQLTRNKDLEIIEKYRVAADKVSYKDGGPGVAFLNAKGVIDKDKLVQNLSSMDDVIDGNFIENRMRQLGAKVSESRLGKALVKTIGGSSGTAKTPWDKAVVGYHILLEEGESRKYLTLNWLNQAKTPFREVVGKDGIRNGMVNIKNAAGEEVRVNLDDVFSNPSKYTLSEGQKVYIDTTHKIIDDLVAEMRANGIDIKELGIEKRGEHYFPRFVKGVDGFEPAGRENIYVKRGLGQKAAFQRERQHATMAGGQKAGNIYAHPEEALEVFFDQANKSIAAKKLLAALEPFGTTGKALALEDVGYVTVKKFNKRLGKEVETKVFTPVYGATAELRKARKGVKQAMREVEAARKGRRDMRVGSGNRKLSMRELSSMANETPEVKAARKSLADAKARKAANEAGIDVQSPVDKKLEASFKKAKDNYDRLLKRKNAYGETMGHTTESPGIPKEQIAAAHQKMVDARNALAADNISRLGSELNDTLASARAQIRAAHNIGREANIGMKGQAIEDARLRLVNAQAKFDAARRHSTQVAREMRSIVTAKSSAMTAPRSVFGLEGDIIPVNAKGEVKLGRSNIMGLQGKLFPQEISDSLGEALERNDITGVLKTISDLNNKARLARASTDFGYLFIQGLPVMMRHPVAFAKSAHQAIKALFDPEGYSRWLASKDAVTRDMYPFAGGFTGSEYFTATKGNFLKQAADLTNVRGNPNLLAKKALGTTMQRFAVSFEAFLDAAKVNMWEGMMPHMKGATDAITRKNKEQYGRLLRNMTGTTSTSRLNVSPLQRHVEALLMFSPRFTRSVFALAAQAAEGGVARREAITSIGAMMAGAVIFYAGTKHAMYLQGLTDEDFSPQDLDPTQGGRFMSIKVGDNWIGLGGSMRGAVQLVGNIAAATQDPKRFLSTDTTSNDKSNPFLKFARGKLSPFGSSAVDLATGSTLIGEDTTDRKKWLARLPDQFLPFAAQTMVETEGGINQKFGALGANAVGFRTFPEAGNEDLNRRVQELSKDKEVQGWTSLTSTQKVEMLASHPEIQKLLDKSEVQNWTDYRELTEQAAKTKAALAARWIKTQQENGGVKVTADDLTSKEYRDQLEKINDKLAGARAVANGADPTTGLGGNQGEFGTPKTGRQALMADYYRVVDNSKFVLPDGTFDFDAKDAVEGQFLASLTDAERKVVAEETVGTSYDPLERRLKEARASFRPYWDLRDEIAQDMGYESALEIAQASKQTQKRYNDRLTKEQEKWRKANPDADKSMAIWGYVSKTMAERDDVGYKSQFGKGKKVTRFGSLTGGDRNFDPSSKKKDRYETKFGSF